MHVSDDWTPLALVISLTSSISIIIKGVAMDTEPYPVVAGLLIRKAVTW